MSENNNGLSLDEIDYTAPAPKKQAPTDVTAPVLDDMDFYTPPPAQKKGAPTGVTAPVLDDMDSYTPPTAPRKGAPTGVTAPVLDDTAEPYQPQQHEVEYMTDEEVISRFSPDQLETFNRLPEASRQKILDLTRQQLGVEAPPEPVEEVTAPVLDDMGAYTPPPPKSEPVTPDDDDVIYMTDEEVIERFTPSQLETYNNLPEANKKKVIDLMRQQLGAEAPPETPLTAPVLDEAPEPPKYQPKFVDEDLERAKREGAKQAVSSQLVSDQKDSKESLRMMLELKEERRREEAKAGFKWVIVLALIGIVAAVSFYLLYTGSLGLDYKDSLSTIGGIVQNSALYITIAMGASSLALVTGIGFFKSLASLIFLLSGIIQIFPGSVMIAQHEGSFGLAVALYIISIVCTIAVFAGMSAIESVSLYFKRKEL